MCTPTLVTRPRDHDHPLIGEFSIRPQTFKQAFRKKVRVSLPGRAIPRRRVRNRVSRLIRALLGFWLYMHIIKSKLPNIQSFLRVRGALGNLVGCGIAGVKSIFVGFLGFLVCGLFCGLSC